MSGQTLLPFTGSFVAALHCSFFSYHPMILHCLPAISLQQSHAMSNKPLPSHYPIIFRSAARSPMYYCRLGKKIKLKLVGKVCRKFEIVNRIPPLALTEFKIKTVNINSKSLQTYVGVRATLVLSYPYTSRFLNEWMNSAIFHPTCSFGNPLPCSVFFLKLTHSMILHCPSSDNSWMKQCLNEEKSPCTICIYDATEWNKDAKKRQRISWNRGLSHGKILPIIDRSKGTL